MYKHDYNIIAFNNNKYWRQPKYATVVERFRRGMERLYNEEFTAVKIKELQLNLSKYTFQI